VGVQCQSRTPGLSKIFRAPIYRAHCAVIFVVAQLSCILFYASHIHHSLKILFNSDNARCAVSMTALLVLQCCCKTTNDLLTETGNIEYSLFNEVNMAEGSSLLNNLKKKLIEEQKELQNLRLDFDKRQDELKVETEKKAEVNV